MNKVSSANGKHPLIIGPTFESDIKKVIIKEHRSFQPQKVTDPTPSDLHALKVVVKSRTLMMRLYASKFSDPANLMDGVGKRKRLLRDANYENVTLGKIRKHLVQKSRKGINMKEITDVILSITELSFVDSPPLGVGSEPRDKLPKPLMDFSQLVCQTAQIESRRIAKPGFIPIMVIAVAVGLAQLLFDVFKYCKSKHGNEKASHRTAVVLHHCAKNPHGMQAKRLKIWLREKLPEGSPIDEIFREMIDGGITLIGKPKWNEVFDLDSIKGE